VGSEKSKASLTTALSLIGKFRQYPWGALFGVALAGALHLFLPALRGNLWFEGPGNIACVVLGMLLERAAHYTFGRFTNVKLEHLATRYQARLKHEDAEYEASLELAKLRKYEAGGVISKEDAAQLADQIARRDVVGGRKPGRPRGPYKKKPIPPPPPPGVVGPPGAAQPESPAA